MALMPGNDKSPSRYFGDSYQMTNWMLYLIATCFLTQHVLGFIPGLLKYRDTHNENGDGHPATANQKGQVQIKMSKIIEILSSQHCTT